MTELKVFTSEGIKQFLNYLLVLKEDPAKEKLLIDKENEALSFEPNVYVDEMIIFSSRLELAEYIHKVFTESGLDRKDVLNNTGLWTWMAYFWFDQICPSINGYRKVGQIARYVSNKDDYRTYYRHLIKGPYNVYSILGVENSRLFLYSPLDKPGDLFEQTASNQKIITVPSLMAVANVLYWDKENIKPKKSASNRNVPGNIRRLVKLYYQFELTYDIYSMHPEKILSLFPSEFNRWKSS